MRIEIENIGPLSQANIDVNGITVIAGKNNVGKSTIGKTLFAIFKNMDVWENIYTERCAKAIYSIMDQENVILEDMCLSLENISRRRTNRVRTLLNTFVRSDDVLIKLEDYKSQKDEISYKELKELLEGFYQNYIELYIPQPEKKEAFIVKNIDKIGRWQKTVLEKLLKLDLDELVMQNSFIINNLNQVFKRQAIKFGEKRSKIRYIDSKGREISITIDSQNNNQDNLISEKSRAFYIETDKIFDYLSDAKHGDDQKEFLQFLMQPNIFAIRDIDRAYNESKEIVNLSMISQDYENISKQLESLMEGRASFYQKVGLEFKDKRYSDPIHAGNISAGLKSMALLEYALRINAFLPGDVLILDEPEINLHPKWQMEYARTIVELNKKYDIKFIITTHSPFFIRAIESFSDLSDQMDTLNVYWLKKVNDNTVVENVSYSEFGVPQIYEDLAEPLDELDEQLEQKYGKCT